MAIVHRHLYAIAGQNIRTGSPAGPAPIIATRLSTLVTWLSQDANLSPTPDLKCSVQCCDSYCAVLIANSTGTFTQTVFGQTRPVISGRVLVW